MKTGKTKKKIRRPIDKLLIDSDFLRGIVLVEAEEKESLVDPSILKSIQNWT